MIRNYASAARNAKMSARGKFPSGSRALEFIFMYYPTIMGNGVMYKCDLCVDRLAENKLPGCVEACPRGAMLIGKRNDIEEVAKTRASRMNGYIYGKTQNGGTSTLYVSPVPFEEINKTMTKKPGQPDMKTDIKRKMAATDSTGKAVLAAPLLGIAAAGITGAWSWISKRKDKAGKEE